MPFPFRHANGNTCCSSPEAMCPKCKARAAAEEQTLRTNIHQEATGEHDGSAPDPYARETAANRAAHATPLSTSQEQDTADRLRELDAEHADIDAYIASHPQPRLTAAELAAIPDPPDPYAAGITERQAKGAR